MFCNAKKDTLSFFKMRHFQASWSLRSQFKLKKKRGNNSRHLTLRRTAAKDSTDLLRQSNENVLRQPQMFCNAKKDTLSIFKMRHLQASHSKRWQFKLKEKLGNNSRQLLRIAYKDPIDEEYQKRIKIYNSPSNPICCSELSYFITKIGHCVHCSVTSHNIQNHKEIVRCAHSLKDKIQLDKISLVGCASTSTCLNLNQSN